MIIASGVMMTGRNLVSGQFRKWNGKLVNIDLAKLRNEVDTSRDYLL
jgi:hypothetical protein